MTEKVIIAAVSHPQSIIGMKEKIPWYISEDLKRFKSKTMGHAIVMGRETYRGLIEKRKGKPLDGRLSVVVSRNPNLVIDHPDVVLVNNIEDAFFVAEEFSKSQGLEKFYIGGGAEIYKRTIDLADRLEITEVHGNFTGDKFFPKINLDVWRETSRDGHWGDGYGYLTYLRR